MSSTARSDYYTVPAEHPRLLPRYCGACPVARVCGERNLETACVHPAAYVSYAFHPAAARSHRRARRSVRFPNPPSTWGDLPETDAIVVGDDVNLLHDLTPAVGLRLAAALATCERKVESRGQVIPFLPGEDDDLARLLRRRGRFVRALAARYPLLVAPPLSLWWGLPPFDGLVILAATLGLAAEFARAMPTIPPVTWRNQRDINRIAAWLHTGQPRAVCVHVGTMMKTEPEWCLQGVRVLSEALARKGLAPRLLAYGVCRPAAMSQIREAWRGPVTFASSKPLLSAEAGMRLLLDLKEVPDPGTDKAELRAINSDAFRAAATRANEAGIAA